jgi:hypothetical protein
MIEVNEKIEWAGHELLCKVALQHNDMVILGDVNDMLTLARGILATVEDIQEMLELDKASLAKFPILASTTIVNGPTVKFVPAKEAFPEA